MDQRREHVRRMLQVLATVQLASPPTQVVVHLIDISKAGVAFAASSPLESGTPFTLSFWLPGTNVPLTAEGKTVYCLETSSGRMYRLGARFTHLGMETAEQIRDFVSAPSV